MHWPFQPDPSRSHLTDAPPGPAKRGLFPWFIGLLCLLASGVASAGPAENARAALRAGTKAFKAKKYVAALASFRKAEPHGALIGELAAIRWNIARTLEELKRYEEVLPALERCLEVAPTAAGRARVQKKMRAIRARLFGQIAVTCRSKGTRVGIDNQPLKPCPQTFEGLRPGQYVVRARLGARPYPPVKAAVKVGKATKLAVPQAGQITLKGPPGQTVRLEGKPLGKTPFTAKGLPPGRYTFDVGENWQPTARLNAGQKLTLTPQTPSADSTITWQTARPWVAGGTAAALVLTSTWFFVEASDNWETAVDLAEQYRNTSDAEIRSDLRARAETAAEDSQRNQIIGGLTLVGGLAAAGLAWWWFDDAQVAIAPDQVILQVRY